MNSIPSEFQEIGKARAQHNQNLKGNGHIPHTDIFIIGGGVNGTAIAADAAHRGLSVTLCEQDDLASGTSSKSTKLIHGGLRYLEYYEFRLVREALKEREILLKKAPHIISPMRFVLPYNKQTKPAWMLKIGLFLYDHLSKLHTLPASEHIYFNQHPTGHMLVSHFKEGFVYSDCWVDDARLVVLNALQAKENGVTILTRTRFISATRQQDHWEIFLEDVKTGEEIKTTTKALINAAGPWVDDVIHKKLHLPSRNHISLVKGSHIILPKLYEENFSFILTNTDNRVIFVIPYLEKYTLIGTTDLPFHGDLTQIEISEGEIAYLCDAVNHYFSKHISPSDVISSYSGVRPLHGEEINNPSAISRDYTLELDKSDKKTPLLSVFGGKITTHRKLAENAMKMLSPFFKNMKRLSTEHNPLPGGDIPNGDIQAFEEDFLKTYDFLPKELGKRLARSYGTRTKILLENINEISDLGEHFGHGLYEKEVNYLISHEWAQSADDILWRRTKLGLSFSAEEKLRLAEWLREKSICYSPRPFMGFAE